MVADAMEVGIWQTSPANANVQYWNNFANPINCHAMNLDGVAWNNLTAGSTNTSDYNPPGQTGAYAVYHAGTNVYDIYP
jgi:hypothetical protein